MHVAVFPLGPLETNCYLVHSSTEAVCIDPGGDPQAILDLLKQKELTLSCIACTHLHFDHTYGVAALHKASNAPVYASEADRYMLDLELGAGGAWGLPRVTPYDFTPLEEGSLPQTSLQCEVLATPGHSPGGLSFYFPQAGWVFAGDTLFARSVGRTDFPGSSFEQLGASIKNKLLVLPESTVVYPGHGPSTTIADEKRNNPFIAEFSI